MAKPREYANYPRDHTDSRTVKHPNPRRHRSLRRDRWTPDRAGIVWTLISALVVVAMFAIVVVYYPFLPPRNANAGFGPDWNCTPHPGGEPTCIKRIDR